MSKIHRNQVHLPVQGEGVAIIDAKWLARQLADLDYDGLLAYLDELDRCLTADSNADSKRGRTKLAAALMEASIAIGTAAFNIRTAARLCSGRKDE